MTFGGMKLCMDHERRLILKFKLTIEVNRSQKALFEPEIRENASDTEESEQNEAKPVGFTPNPVD